MEKLAACEETRLDTGRSPSLAAGEYTTDLFRPRYSFRVGPGWGVFHRRETALQIAKRRDPHGLILEFDSFGGNRTVAERLDQLTSFPGVDVSTAVTATVGGMIGKRADLLVTATQVVAVPGLSAHYELEPEDRLRIYVIPVRGVSVAILVEAQASEFAPFFAEVESVLASVDWA